MPRIYETLILIPRSIKIIHTHTLTHNEGRKGEEIEGEEEEITEEKYQNSIPKSIFHTEDILLQSEI